MSDTNNLLRFLTQEAKLPLATAIAQAAGLQKAKLVTIDDIFIAGLETIKSNSPDEKTAKSTFLAAKRVSIKRKRGIPETNTPTSRKRVKIDPHETTDPVEVETSLDLPTSSLSEEELSGIVLVTNRAPLMLAFAACLVKHTMPEQPPSSRLSLAQAVTSMNAKAKASSIGINNQKSAEDEGWGQGQASVKVMGRDVRVLKRWGYEWKPKPEVLSPKVKSEETESDVKAEKKEEVETTPTSEEGPALWALDLEQLKSLNGPPIVGASASATGLPVYAPQSARNYILRAFDNESPSEIGLKKKTASEISAEREANLGHLLKSLDLLFESWSPVLDSTELDKRAWSWYVRVRPEIQGGTAGWGAKGQVKLKEILDLRRTT